ncbi:hypothetical protein DB41_EY00070 [Neochlamydia sp. TUME1]|nr:hypothetical protein DB41_EY00070 [Neochlamydia sp. TUME1]
MYPIDKTKREEKQFFYFYLAIQKKYGMQILATSSFLESDKEKIYYEEKKGLKRNGRKIYNTL